MGYMLTTEKTPQIEESMLLAMSAGTSLTSWCKQENVSLTAVYRWLHTEPDFEKAFLRARLVQADTLAEQILDISDDFNIPYEHKRFMVESRRWYAGKLNQGKYGDKQTVELTGKDGEPLSLRLIEAQQRLMKDVTPLIIEHKQDIVPEDLI